MNDYETIGIIILIMVASIPLFINNNSRQKNKKLKKFNDTFPIYIPEERYKPDEEISLLDENKSQYEIDRDISSLNVIDNQNNDVALDKNTNKEKLYRIIDFRKTSGTFKVQYFDDGEIVTYAINIVGHENNLKFVHSWIDIDDKGLYKRTSEGSFLPQHLASMNVGDIDNTYQFKLLEKKVDYHYYPGIFPEQCLFKSKYGIYNVYELDNKYVSDKKNEFFSLLFNDNKINYLYPYIPKRYGTDEISSKIIDMKNKLPDAIEYFYEVICNWIDLKRDIHGKDKNIVICVVPGHEASNKNTSSIAIIARRIVRRYDYIDGIDNLIRIKSVLKKSQSNSDRSIELERETTKIVNPEIFFGKSVIILDDVTTTGNSFLNAIEKIGYFAYTYNIDCLAVGKTVHKDE